MTFQVTSDLINVVVGLGRGFQEGDALALCKLLSTVTLHNPLLFPVTLAANQQPLHTWGSMLERKFSEDKNSSELSHECWRTWKHLAKHMHLASLIIVTLTVLMRCNHSVMLSKDFWHVMSYTRKKPWELWWGKRSVFTKQQCNQLIIQSPHPTDYLLIYWPMTSLNLALFPGHSQILSRSCWEKSGHSYVITGMRLLWSYSL